MRRASLECGDRSRRFAVREPQLALSSPRMRELRLARGKALTAVSALQNDHL